MEISNVSFPDHPAADITIIFTDTATGLVRYGEFTEGDVIDLTDFYPLMQHYYELKFLVDGVQVNFTITNPDDTTVIGCCMEFIPSEGLAWVGSLYDVSTTQCTTE